MIVIAGPCVIEGEEEVLSIARKLCSTARFLKDNDIDFVFKASFDKANRSSINSYRGVNIEQAVDIFKQIQLMGLKITTDIHEPWQAEVISECVDIIQIPAFLSRQTDLLEAAAKTGKPVNVKKGQFMAPEDMNNVISKLKHFGCSHLYLTERGTFFGYGHLVNDMTSIVKMKSTGFPVIFDATHSVQEPGGLGETSGGNRRFVVPLAKAALAIGADGLFFEVHPDPDNALSDGPNMLKLDEFDDVLKGLLSIQD
jgi:2-dehydro-3-deoxyphosphooctonate aldolase (KDO 8-P synthase)|tara:strand:- start:58594 stop:59358 length:765 start_codon:yes stop_codon:yes gene_type:complete